MTRSFSPPGRRTKSGIWSLPKQSWLWRNVEGLERGVLASTPRRLHAPQNHRKPHGQGNSFHRGARLRVCAEPLLARSAREVAERHLLACSEVLTVLEVDAAVYAVRTSWKLTPAFKALEL